MRGLGWLLWYSCTGGLLPIFPKYFMSFIWIRVPPTFPLVLPLLMSFLSGGYTGAIIIAKIFGGLFNILGEGVVIWILHVVCLSPLSLSRFGFTPDIRDQNVVLFQRPTSYDRPPLFKEFKCSNEKDGKTHNSVKIYILDSFLRLRKQ